MEKNLKVDSEDDGLMDYIHVHNVENEGDYCVLLLSVRKAENILRRAL